MKIEKNRSSIPSPLGRRPKVNGRSAARPDSLAEMNKKLAATKAARLKAAEENCIKLTGKDRF